MGVQPVHVHNAHVLSTCRNCPSNFPGAILVNIFTDGPTLYQEHSHLTEN